MLIQSKCKRFKESINTFNIELWNKHSPPHSCIISYEKIEKYHYGSQGAQRNTSFTFGKLLGLKASEVWNQHCYPTGWNFNIWRVTIIWISTGFVCTFVFFIFQKRLNDLSVCYFTKQLNRFQWKFVYNNMCFTNIT